MPAIGVGHEEQALSDVRCADAVCAHNCRPDGVVKTFQVCANKVEPIVANRRCNLGYWVRSGATGQGIAPRAALLTRDWAFEHTALVRIEVVIAVGNHRSIRVAEKSGAFREGVLRKRLLLHGVHEDAVMFSFVRP